MPFAVQVARALVAAPVSSTSASAVVFVAPAALFQFAWATAPARSDAPIGVVLLPRKLIAIGLGAVVATGTICTALTGARRVPDAGSVGAAVRVNAAAVIRNLT